MRIALKRALFGLLLCTCANTLHAGVIYQFQTILELESGPNTTGLDGAAISFTAIFTDGSTYENEPLFSMPIALPASFAWNVAGSVSVDGLYTSTDPFDASWAPHLGLFGQAFNFATLVDPYIWHQSNGLIAVGDPVSPTDFLRLRPPSAYATLWRTRDQSEYNWIRNASFSVRDSAAIPLPPILSLMAIALSALMFWRRTCVAPLPSA